MQGINERESFAKPYKGPESFDTPDELRFFGRTREKEQLVAKVLSSRCTLLHAPSGAGKTSLLRAGVLPGLELCGWTPIPIRLGDNPVESVRVTTLHSLLPSPLAEAKVVSKACGMLARSQEAPLGQLINTFNGLHHFSLLEPVSVELEPNVAAVPPPGPIAPLFSRLLRKTLDLRSYSEHLSAISEKSPSLTEETSAAELLDWLTSQDFVQAHSDCLSDLYIPIPGLGTFFENLQSIYGRRRSQFGIVLLLDQFEELFTRFADIGAAVPDSGPRPLDWRLKRDFLNELEALYRWTYKPESEQRNSPPGVLPVRLLISLRDEYVAQLEAVKSILDDPETSDYRLGFLDRKQAEEAIREPAKTFNFDFSQGWYTDILTTLTREDRYVEPTPLQILCEKLWQLRGRELSASRDSSQKTVERDQDLGTAAQILTGFFQEFIGELDTEAEQLETLDLLEPLVTTSRTRNIVERNVLVRRPLRDWKLRERLLDRLLRKKIVRQERRLGGDFIEITHEFLLAPVLDLIRQRLQDDPAPREFGAAVRSMERLLASPFRRGTEYLLSANDLDTLEANRGRIAWDAASTELMLRSVLVRGRQSLLTEWWQRYQNAESIPPAPALLSPERTGQRGGVLSLEEYKAVMADESELTSEQAEFMLYNAIVRTNPWQKDIGLWVERIKHGQKA